MPLVPAGFNIAHVLFVCRQLTSETGTSYWYQKTGQCVWPFKHFEYTALPRTRDLCLKLHRLQAHAQWSLDYYVTSYVQSTALYTAVNFQENEKKS